MTLHRKRTALRTSDGKAESLLRALLGKAIPHRPPQNHSSNQRIARLAFSQSEITIEPGLCVMQNDGRARSTASCAVTPQAQNTGISSGRICGGFPLNNGLSRSIIPISSGALIWMGAPWTLGKRDVIYEGVLGFLRTAGPTLSAFNAFGRLSRTMPTRPLVSTMTVSYAIGRSMLSKVAEDQRWQTGQ